MRKKRLVWNSFTVIFNQIVIVISGFIVPRMILGVYGSTVNSLVSSITQFLAVITFMDMGIGTVVQASLYKPLAEKDSKKISMIVSSADRFFKKIAFGILLYVIILVFAYPRIVNQSFGAVYTGTLILAMCINYFAQYFFGLKNQLLITADQKGYIAYVLNSILIIANSVISVVMITYGASIQFVKLVASLVLLLKPLVLEIYVRAHYKIDKKIQYTGEPIKQKGNGIAQHIATVVLNSTDMIVLSLFAFESVSVYYVYHLVVNGVNNLIVSLTSGFLSLFGNMISKKENDLLLKTFNAFEIIFHFGCTFVYGCILVLIIPFVRVYTKGINDADYNVPVFAVLITLANLVYCYRLPYNTLIKAAGHFKQTQDSAIIEAVLNIVLSVLLVVKFGLIGVAVGTLVAMTYKTIYLVMYLRRNIINRDIWYFMKHVLVDTVCISLIYLIGRLNELTEISYLGWIILAIKSAMINFSVCAVAYLMFFRQDIIKGYNLLVHRGR